MTPTRRITAALTAFALGVGGAVAFASPAAAASFTVTSAADSGAGTLRAAIASANGSAGPHTITFQAGLADIVLTSGSITITEELTLSGPGSSALSIVLDAGPGPIFTVTSGENLTINDLDFIGDLNGSAIFAPTIGTLTINDSVFGGFVSTDEGGAISLFDANGLQISGSTFAANSAALPGGAIYVDDLNGPLVVDGSTFENNLTGSAGGAIFANTVEDVTITSSSFSGNSAEVAGGAIGINSINADSEVEIDLTTFDANLAGVAGATDTQGAALYLGLVSDGATVLISRSSITNNDLTVGGSDSGGGGMFVNQIDGSVEIVASTFAGNSSNAPAAGLSIGVCDVTGDGVLRLINSTLDEASAQSIYNVDVCTNSGTVEILYSTLVGPAILRIGTNGGDALITSSIIDGNAAAVNALNIDGADLDVTWSTLSMPAGTPMIAAGAGVQFDVTDPKLGPLQNNGGPTLTRLLLAGSPALDMGDPAVSGQPSFDQRGSGFPRVIGGRIDIGAIEMPRTLPATGAELPVPLLIGGILLIIVGAALIIVRIRRRA